IKSLFRLSLRMVTGFVQSLIKLCGLNWIAPDYTTLCRRQKHIGIDAKTLQIRAVQLTTNNVSDSQVLGDLLNQIPQNERIDSVYTDEAYDT
ncbi:transposase, partial [Acinetobacter gandensis]|uniref:transposase n=1 Tax=Acinetobacter gandensis TaxID=1443941 RepID=UPI001243F779